MSKTTADAVNLEALPGHYIRRLQQIAVSIFLQETAPLGVTPVQYAALQAISNTPGIDQRTLAATIGFDTSTIAGVIDRLEARALVARSASADDRRVRLLSITAVGTKLLRELVPPMLNAQIRMLDPLTKTERETFMRLLQKVVEANNEHSRAPRNLDGGAAT